MFRENISESNVSTETKVFFAVTNGIPITYRITPHSTTNVALCTLFMKRDLQTRFGIRRPDISGKVTSKQAQKKLYHYQHSAGRELFIGQRVANGQKRSCKRQMDAWNYQENWSFIIFGASYWRTNVETSC